MTGPRPPATHPLWRPFELADLDQVAAVRIVRESSPPVVVVDPDPAWPAAYDAVARRLREALGERALAVEHVGSTAVPGLPAKPVIDVDLVVADPADEPAWLPDLEAAGFALRVREPDHEEHRMLRGSDPLRGLASNVHVFGPGAREPRRHVLFRDHLRSHEPDRRAYGEHKRRIADEHGFTDAMDYNNHKAWLVYDIYERAFAADPAHPHDPHPR
ncbi:GrpB family protein [Nocardioides sp. zg-579]|uniref:GrpB family protein n=1 Tax=Nocardioides marmotae TaxID=2663857 RepID=A0A6I3J8D8_9ACTN|nr:GrpB family protein [Nocardioides marmotae]MCR6031081.1 GrpB family protein [Gordonia jinghuaiqii]MTB94719.1 GrpB family protein [Nocardioides marmotae]QKE01280.1 GrpB family protein [Nocardioides marmotae]